MDQPAMSQDISRILQGWDFDPEELIVRIVVGDDGQEKIQLRLDMGLLQMELNGRPDGQRPEGHESWLDYYEHQQRMHDLANPDSVPFVLEDADCARLWREGIQYYHRSLSCWHLERFELVVRDTARSLRLFTFVRTYGQTERAKLQFDQWRPYVTMMHTRSIATPLVREGEYDRALQVIEAGIDAIHEFLDEYQQSQRAEECVELVNLERWRDEVRQERRRQGGTTPEDALDDLRRQLQEAVAAEKFEEAARLRDEIRRLSAEQPNP
jgi:hypothetical protein